MTCDEVIELMQRHLDGDLNSEEEKRMMHHLEACPECAAFKERLERIDRDLASLPKVTPPFSLVDAILPQLQQIDASIHSDRVHDNGEQAKPASREWTDRKRPRAWWMRVGGTVAAAAVLGVLIVNGLSDELLRAPVAMTERSSGSSANSSAASSAASTMSGAASILSIETSQEEARQNFAAVPESAPPQAKAADAVSRGSAGMPAPEAIPEADPLVEPLDGNNNTKSNDHGSQDHQDRSVKASPPEEVPAAELESGQGFGLAAVPPSIVGQPATGEDVGISSVPDTVSGGEQEYPQLASESGEYVGKVNPTDDGAQIRVVITDGFGETLFVSGMVWSREDAISFLSWEGHLLKYAVETTQGVRSFMIDASQGTEAEISE